MPPSIHGGGTACEGSPVRIDFSTGVNAYGPAPVVRRAVREALALAAALERYPDSGAIAPRRAAADAWRVPVECVAFGAGGTELIYAVCLAYVGPGDRVLVPRPAFGEYARAALLAGAAVQEVPAEIVAGVGAESGAVADAFLDGLGTVRPRLVLFAAPTSPVGTAIAREDLVRVANACERLGALLVLDQSYDAFAAVPLGTPALPGHPAVVHVRSITKDHALAGVRAGFAIGAVPVIAAIEKTRAPWATSTIAQVAAVAALSAAAEAHAASTIARLRSGAAALADACGAMGLHAVRSDTHYFLLDVGNGGEFRSQLLVGHGLVVRDCASFGLPAYVRIAARTEPENAMLVEAIARLERAEHPYGGNA